MKIKQKYAYYFALAFGTVLLTLAGCATKPAPEEVTVAEPAVAVRSIAVLPVKPIPKGDDYTPEELRQLESGAVVLNRLLAEHFKGVSAVQVVSEDQMEALASDFTGNRIAAGRNIGKSLHSDAVLMVGLTRFVERQGESYSIISPASVAFECRLVAVESGRTLWHTLFDETQQSLFENMLTFPRAVVRGFKWITAETLAREGLEAKLEKCPYLSELQ